MRLLVFVPGIMGSELRSADLSERVWPPTLLQAVRKTVDVDKLLRDDLVATKPIRSVVRFYALYRALLDDIERCGYSTSGSQKRFLPFAYDWRKSNVVTAQALSDTLNQQDEFEEVVFLGHSMGGLILRYLLESGEFDEQPWFKKVRQLITLGTPHYGAAAALKQICGLDDNVGLSKEGVKRLTSDSRYPSAYQLVPPDDTGMVVTANTHSRLPQPISAFSADIVSTYQLNPQSIDAAQQFWQKLDQAKRPQSVNYFSFVGSAHSTLYRLDWNGSSLLDQKAKESGDATVPVSSALNTFVPHAFSQKKHAKIFEDRELRQSLYRMLGAAPGMQPQSASRQAVGEPDAMGMSTDRENYAPQDTVEVAVSFTETRDNPRAMFQLVRLDETQSEPVDLEFVGEPIRAAFDASRVNNFRFAFEIDLSPGVYELRCSDIVDDPEPCLFVVSDEQLEA